MLDLAFYSCYLGGEGSYSRLIPPMPSKDYPCYFFTNVAEFFNDIKNSSGKQWIPVWCDNPIHDNFIANAMETKELRCCPHRFPELSKHKLVCWFDSKIEITNLAACMEMVEAVNGTDKPCLALTAHPMTYNTVWDEYNSAMDYEHYAEQREQNVQYINGQLANGRALSPGLRVACGFTVRRMCDRANTIGDTWLEHVHMCGVEDQISFQFVHQMFEQDIAVFPMRYCWDCYI